MANDIRWLVVHDLSVVVADGPLPERRPPFRLLPESLEFGVLGPVEVRRGGERLAVGGHRQLNVLTVLLLDAGRVVSLDRLVDALWGEAPPPAARGTLHTYLSKLRRVLEAARPTGITVLASRGGGYVLDVDRETIDAARFERLAAEGRAALAAGAAERAAARFAQALALWRGPALADFAFEPFAAPEIARLEELRLSVMEDRVEAALLLGHHRAVIADLEPLVAAHPFRERLRAQLMVALYRGGRQAEALRTYQAGRRLLAEELGLQPSPALRALEAAILRHHDDLDSEADGCRPVRAATANSGRSIPRAETTTFLCADVDGVTVVGSTYAAPVVVRHLVAEAVERHGGQLCDEQEPNRLLAVFPGARQALAAAFTLQRALAGESWPRGVTTRVRIGLPGDDPAGEERGPGAPRSSRHRNLGAA